jgi:ketosteroid isomerase-like protein
MDSEKTHDIVAGWYNAMGQFDWDTVIGDLDDNVVFTLAPKPYTKMIPYLGVWEGKEKFLEASKIRNDTSQISGLELHEVIAQGNKAVALITSKATCIATGIYFELDIVQFIELNDEGKIVKVTAYFDPVPEMNAFRPDFVSLEA